MIGPDESALETLNIGIGDAENRGDAAWLAAILAPRMTFQRADPARTIDDRETFLSKVSAGGKRATEVLKPIQLFGDRAVVRCIVTIEGKRFDNLRLFVKRDGRWLLLGWANQAI